MQLVKNLFPGHYRPSEDEFKSLWRDGLFVFDTNVLLNLYSYPESAREIFFKVLNRVIDRTWIPYQVALEFHKNRFARIKQSNKPLLELRDRIQASSAGLEADFKKIEFDKRNTGIDDLHERLRAVRDANSKLAEALDLACNRLPSVTLNDPIGAQIAQLLEGRIGEPPADQAALNALTQDGEARYEKQIPPGYEDAKQKRDLQYYDRGLTYAGKFGDLILWRQTMAFVAASKKKDVIFITADGKDDWWSTHEGRTIGPAPELVQEFLLGTGAERFWIYRAAQFLENAEQYLSAEEVTKETIAQVKETDESQYMDVLDRVGERVAAVPTQWDHHFGVTDSVYYKAGERIFSDQANDPKFRADIGWMSQLENAVTRWAMNDRRAEQVVTMRHLDFAVIAKEKVHGYQIIAPRRLNRRILNDAIRAASVWSKELPIEDVTLVLALSFDEYLEISDAALDRFAHDVVKMLFNAPIYSVVIGYIKEGAFESVCTIEGEQKGLPFNKGGARD